MADNQSIASEWTGNYTVEQLGSKLLKTREQLKKAIGRIVALEERESQTLKRLGALELRVAVELTKPEAEQPVLENESVDSLQGIWQTEKRPDQEGQISPPNDPPVLPQTNKGVRDVQGEIGGDSGSAQGLEDPVRNLQ